LRKSRFCGYITESAVTVIVIKGILPVITDEEIFESIIVVITNTNPLSPTGARETCSDRDIGKRAVAIVLKQMAGWLFRFGKSFEMLAIHEEDVEPSIVVVVVKCDSAAGCLEKIFVLLHSTENGLGVQTCLASNIDERNTERIQCFSRWPCLRV